MLILSAVEVAMFARAVLSWIMPDGEGFLIDLIYMMTEPVIIPFRKLFERLHWFEGSPIDFSFLFATITLMIASTALTVFQESIITF